MDREASFEPQSIPKRTRDVSGIEDKSEDASTALQAMKNPRKAGRRRKNGPEAQEQIKALSAQGKTIREISAETGIPKSTVQRLKKNV
nr:helix-turn-helix domain-containing protein [Enterocloster clostridioformis]